MGEKYFGKGDIRKCQPNLFYSVRELDIEATVTATERLCIRQVGQMLAQIQSDEQTFF